MHLGLKRAIGLLAVCVAAMCHPTLASAEEPSAKAAQATPSDAVVKKLDRILERLDSVNGRIHQMQEQVCQAASIAAGSMFGLKWVSDFIIDQFCSRIDEMQNSDEVRQLQKDAERFWLRLTDAEREKVQKRVSEWQLRKYVLELINSDDMREIEREWEHIWFADADRPRTSTEVGQ